MARFARAIQAARKYVRDEGLKIDDGTLAAIVGIALSVGGPQVVVEEFEEICDECDEAIPIVIEGGLANRYHAPSCSLYDSGRLGGPRAR